MQSSKSLETLLGSIRTEIKARKGLNLDKDIASSLVKEFGLYQGISAGKNHYIVFTL